MSAMRSLETTFLVDKGLFLLQTAGKLILIWALVLAARKLICTSISRYLSRGAKSRLVEERRMRTLMPLLQSVLSYTIYFIGLVSVLEVFGVKTTSLIATAGLASLAIGFGAQNLVRDVVTGFFILLEDQFAVGDRVSVAGVTGIVMEMGLRTTKVVGDDGRIHIVPNGQISQVTNHIGSRMTVSISIPFPRSVPLATALSLMERVAQDAAGIPDFIDSPTLVGVTSLSEASYSVDISGTTAAESQVRTELHLRAIAKRVFEEADI